MLSDERVEKNKEEREMDWHTTGEVITGRLWLVRARIWETYLPHFYIEAESRVEAGYKVQKIVEGLREKVRWDECWEGRETVEWKSYPATVHVSPPALVGCEAGYSKACGAPETSKCPCCDLWLCSSHSH